MSFQDFLYWTRQLSTLQLDLTIACVALLGWVAVPAIAFTIAIATAIFSKRDRFGWLRAWLILSMLIFAAVAVCFAIAAFGHPHVKKVLALSLVAATASVLHGYILQSKLCRKK